MNVTIYTLPGCPHCARARRILQRLDAEFDEVDGRGVAGFRSVLAATTGGWTVPQIVIGDHPIGGADELARLRRLGVLQWMLAGKPFPAPTRRRRVTRQSLVRWMRGPGSHPAGTELVWRDRYGSPTSDPTKPL